MATHHRNFQKNDEWYTPSYAVEPLLRYIKSHSTIWCPFDTCESNFVKVFQSNGHNVIHTHIDDGVDFLKTDLPQCDYIISNPPYSKKTEVFARLMEFGKPFAMLCNFQGMFDNKKRFEIFKDKGTQLMVLYPRVGFYNDEVAISKRVPFQSAYVCKDILKESLVFEFCKGGS